MKRFAVLCLAACLLLSGCASIMDGRYVSVTPHQAQSSQTGQAPVQASDYSGLLNALEDLAENGLKSGIIYMSRYDQNRIEDDIKNAVDAVTQQNPIAAYAVDTITWELGTNNGQNAVAVNITYTHDQTEIRKIRKTENLEGAKEIIYAQLNNCAAGAVLFVENYVETDFAQLVEDYAFHNPHLVMESPDVTVNTYPRFGSQRVVELKFSYQNSRDALRNMAAEVSPVFASAALYVSGDARDYEKFSQLYSFLTERYDYRFETSITPAYSLLRHGVGDARAFATVYAAMCREAGLTCEVISGTRWGEPWTWNVVSDEGFYFHVDLLHSKERGYFEEWSAAEMDGYVWDYSAYPMN